MFKKLKQDFRDIKRVNEIIAVFTRQGLKSIFSSKKENLIIKDKKNFIDIQEKQKKEAKKIRLALEELGGGFIKIGQHYNNIIFVIMSNIM